MTIKETCSCGASIEVSLGVTRDTYAAEEWRKNHQHDSAGAYKRAYDAMLEGWKTKVVEEPARGPYRLTWRVNVDFINSPNGPVWIGNESQPPGFAEWAETVMRTNETYRDYYRRRYGNAL